MILSAPVEATSLYEINCSVKDNDYITHNPQV